jgi:GNAT superfamily N-acetyltransferase
MINADLLIRQANIKDAEQVMALIRRAMTVYAHNSKIESSLESLTETIHDIKQGIIDNYVLVAENRDGDLAGTVKLLLPVPMDDLPDVAQEQITDIADCNKRQSAVYAAWFTRFAVIPELHASGVGKLIYQAAEDYLVSQGISIIMLHTANTNRRLVNFYQARGFILAETDNSRGYERGLYIKQL